ncbi:MAG: Wzz/FepE/Etk N-terminal domain-containing protein, partial [Gemmatimonadales bacterium]
MDSGRDRSQNVPAPSELRPVDPVGSQAREPALGVDYRLEPHLPQDGIDPRRYLLAVWRHKWLVMLVTFLGTAAGVGGTRFIEPQYEAEATLWIETVRGTDARQGPIQSSELLRSSGWVDLLHSYVVLDQVVRDMQLYLQVESAADSAAFAGFAVVDRPVPGSYRLQVSNRGDVVDLYAEGGRLVETVPAGDSVGLPSGFTWAPPRHALRPGAVIEFEVANPREVANSVAGAMRTRLNPNGNFFHVGFRGTDPEETAAILNEITGRYVEVAAELKAAKLEEYREKLNDQLGYAWQNLEQAEAALENFRVQTITLPSEPASPVAPGLELTRDPAFANFFELKVDEDQLRRDREDLERVLAGAADGRVSIDALEV